MTSLELKQKLDSAQVAVDKRLVTIAKLESKLTEEDINTVKVAKSLETYKQRQEHLNAYYKAKGYSYENQSKLDQVYDNYGKLQEVESVRDNWQVKYSIQLNKENAPKIKVLWDFLNDWGTKVVEWYTKNSEHYVKVLNDYKALQREFYEENDFASADGRTKNNAESCFIKHLKEKYDYALYDKRIYDAKDYAKYLGNIPELTISLTNARFFRDENYDYCKLNNVVYAYGEYKLISFDTEKLNKIIEQEKLAKYFDLCNRISDVVGEITSVDMLSIGNQQGELNGLVEGTKGKCFVETISAGGYNIQCFHYRVLIKKVK